MNKTLLTILLAGSASIAFAQKSEITQAKNAWNLFQISAGNNSVALDKKLNDLKAGLQHAEAATVHEKTKTAPDAWSHKALFASAIAVVDTVNLQNSESFQKVAEEALAKTKELDTKNAEKEAIATAEVNIQNAVKVRAYTAYNKKDYKNAQKYFEQITAINPKDTAMFKNAAVMASLVQDYPAAIANYKKYAAFNTADAKETYSEMVNLSMNHLKDTAAAVAIAKEAAAKFPTDDYFVQVETQYYINKGDIAKSEEMIDKLLAKNPNNSMYQYLKGDVYYKQALAAQAAKNKIDIKKTKEIAAADKKLVGLIDQALPYYKKAAELDPKNRAALESLQQIYGFKNDNANYEAIKKQIAALPAN
ncbi:hypothetical protein C7T94_10535 [Pedobacter yulinensis]|uniref:Tetratricopeptide repeat protein n=2 Tax=Pedobacter yulinensis TaxID=2126353 RepID=A0A2T3HN23_9SPHI|nr:hypothetical protein C7T94_10535 [Pedobacter yulinensis]